MSYVELWAILYPYHGQRQLFTSMAICRQPTCINNLGASFHIYMYFCLGKNPFGFTEKNMVDRIRKMFGTKDEDSGNPVGYIESVVSKMDISNMPEPIQKVDLWLRQYIPMKRPEDCLYCKLISCSIITAGTVYIAKIVPKTMKTKYTSTGPRLVYGTFTTVLVACKYQVTVSINFGHRNHQPCH